jgi:hypothetical protein
MGLKVQNRWFVFQVASKGTGYRVWGFGFGVWGWGLGVGNLGFKDLVGFGVCRLEVGIWSLVFGA